MRQGLRMKIKCKFCKTKMEFTDAIWEGDKLTRYYYCLECDRFIIRSLTKEEVEAEDKEGEECLM